MGYTWHLERCNSLNALNYKDLFVGEMHIGLLRAADFEYLIQFQDTFTTLESGLSFNRKLRTQSDRTASFAEVLSQMRVDGRAPAFRGEAYAVSGMPDGPLLMTVDRSAATLLGIIQTGVHMNGLVRRKDGIHMWVARRAGGARSHPGKLDNMVAGGRDADRSYTEILVKECGEEAGIPEELALRALPTSVVSCAMDADDGARRFWQVAYDLWLPEDFVPRPVDGEVDAFTLLPIEEVADIVRTSDAFKFDCALIVIDALVRHGLIRPDDPGYGDIVSGLRPSLAPA